MAATFGAFDNSLGDFTNTTAELGQFVRIAGLWDDLRTDGTPPRQHLC